MKAFFVLVFFSLIQFSQLSAQKSRYFNAGPGGAYSLHNDKGLSSLPYEGIQFAGYLSLEKSSERNWNELALQMQGGFLSPVDKSGSATRGFLKLSYQHLYQTKWGKKKLDINFGPAVGLFADNIFHDQYSNNIIHPIWDLTLGIAGRANRNFYLFKRRFNAAFWLDIPLWGVAMRPDYAYGGPRGFYMHPENYWMAVRDSYFYVYPPKLIRVNTNLSFTYYLKNLNAIGLIYRWNYSNLNALTSDAINDVEGASHGLYFVTKFRF